MICSAIIDDFIEAAGYKEAWWQDEVMAIFRSLTVILCSWALTAVLKFVAAGIIEKRSKDAGTAWTFNIIRNGIITLLWVGTGFIVIKIWEISLTPFMASAGILTVAMSFFSKHISGLSVYLNRPYVIGDYLVLSTGERGEVVRVGIANTHIRTRDDIHIIVPNYIMSSTKVVNESIFFPHSRVRCSVGVAYDSDLDQVEKVLLGSLGGNQCVIDEPAPRVRFRSFGETAIQVDLLAWVKDPRDRGRALDVMVRNIHRACKEAGIEIPSPKMELSIKSENLELRKKLSKAFHDPEGE
ncbi:MAG: mechanosensitive ion channel [Deltaproteobacteria bacterium]|nr:mechanosensitive ion channel [Deltaproteobacteria bacterium]